MGGQELRAYNNREQVFSLTLSEGYGLLSARPNQSGWLAVTAQQSRYKGVVTVYDNKFSPKMELRYSSDFLVDAALSEDSRQVAAVTMGQGDESFESGSFCTPWGRRSLCPPSLWAIPQCWICAMGSPSSGLLGKPPFPC